jgi:1-acyl-sn-glycerol-3-phosphate acyltransferase
MMEAGESTRGAGGTRRGVLRWLYLPWAWLVFLPVFAASTLFWALIAVLVSLVSRRAAFHCGTIWAWCLCRLNLTHVRLEGRECAKPGQSYVIMSNHQSHFDVLAFYGHWGRQFRWVIKQELRKVPGLGFGCAAVGHVFIDRSDREKALASLRAARAQLTDGVSVMFFPEGTRSLDGRLGPFKKGGFMMALELGLPILPVSISGSRHVLPAQSLTLSPGTIRIRIHPPIETAGRSLAEREQLIEETAAAIRSGLTPWEQGLGARPETARD